MISSARFAAKMHYGQKRADGSPYIYHPMRVAGILKALGYDNEDLIDAAWLHDVYEDTWLEPPDLCSAHGFNQNVHNLVVAVTNVYTKEAYPQHSRAVRKHLEITRLSQQNDQAQIIKAVDRMDNLCFIDCKGKKFAELYRKESLDLIIALRLPDRLKTAILSMIQNPGFVPELFL